MHVSTNYAEKTWLPPKGGQLSWLLDTAIIGSAAVCIFATVVPAGIWTHRGQTLNPPSAFVARGDPDATEAAAGPTGAPLLWRVHEGNATVYLFGSVSSRHPDLGWMDPRLFQAFDGADEVWLAHTVRTPALGDLAADRGPSLLLAQRAARLNKHVTMGNASDTFDEDVAMSNLWRMGDERGMVARTGFLGTLGLGQGPDTARLEAALKGGKTVFVATDMARLLGSGGLVAQLRRDGHKVERLDP